MRAAFWVSAPLFAVYLAASWAGLPGEGLPRWPGDLLLYAVVASSAFLTLRMGLPAAPASPRRRALSEWAVYPVALLLAAYLLGAHVAYY